MTKGQQIAEKSAFSENLPAYEGKHDMHSERSTSEECKIHGPSQTPHLDAQLRQPAARAALLALSKALADAANGDQCTRCATESAAQTLMGIKRELKESKKSGNWSKEDKKVMKQEAKWLFKGVKESTKGTF